MKRQVITHNEIEGFHYYPDAPDFCAYLAQEHRHIFVIECGFNVSHNEREIEINHTQHEIADLIKARFDQPAIFGAMSCEAIAEFMLDSFGNMDYCKVLEDGYGGATLTR